MLRWVIGAALTLTPLPAIAGQVFNFDFQFSRDGDEIYHGTGSFTTDDAVTLNGDGTKTYTLTGADGTIVPNFDSDPATYTIVDISDFFGLADNTITQSGATVSFNSLAIFFDGGPGFAYFDSADADVFAGEALFSLDHFDITPVVDTPVMTAVPEPASWAMMVGGFGLLGAAARRRRAAQPALA